MDESPLMTQLQELLPLQELDLAIDHARRQLKAIAAGEPWAERARHRDEAAARVERLKAELERWNKKRRAAEMERQSAEASARRLEERLYGGSIRNTKEFDSMNNEIAALRGRIGDLETSELEAMEELDRLNQALSAAQEAAAAAQDAVGVAQARAHQRNSELAQQLAADEERRTSLAAAVDADLLQQYEAARRAGQGRAMGVLSGETCGACGVELARAIVQRVQRGTLQHCDNCGRMLVLAGRPT